MKCAKPFNYLGSTDVEPILSFIDSLGSGIWYENDFRQTNFDVHKDTVSIVLKFDALYMHSKYDELLNLIKGPLEMLTGENPYTIHRLMVANLPAGKSIRSHTDRHPLFSVANRVHIVLKTNDGVSFTCADVIQEMKVGQIWELSNRDTHGVKNNGETDRWHLIFDLEYI